MADNYTFYPKFEEFVTLYRGVVRVWIGDGETTGEAGYLFAEYIDGLVQQLGYVSDYAEAKKIFADLGKDLTYTEWVELLTDVPENALAAQNSATAAALSEEKAEKWATGGSDGTPSETNNAKYYANQALAKSIDAADSADSALNYKNDSETAKEQAQAAKNEAEEEKTKAEAWATGGTGGTATPTNNAKYYAIQAETSATNAETSAINADSSATDANNSAAVAENWATGGTGGTASSTNNAKYYSEQSQLSAVSASDFASAANVSKTAAETAQENAEIAQSNAEAAQTNAETAKVNAETAEDNAESWAAGTKNGIEIDSSDPAYRNNAKYYAGVAKEQATNAENSASDAATSKAEANVAKNNAETAEDNAEAWAVGQKNGADVSPSDVTYHNNSKYYAQRADLSSQNAADSAANAALSETKAEDSAISAENWATGATGGIATTTNNAKYYAEFAANQAASIQAATVAVMYQNSDNGMYPPTSGTWTNNPNPQFGKFIWSKTTITWLDDSISTIYNVSYIGANGTGSVNSVNAKGGDVILYGSDIHLTQNDNRTVTDTLNDVATDAEIAALFP